MNFSQLEFKLKEIEKLLHNLVIWKASNWVKLLLGYTKKNLKKNKIKINTVSTHFSLIMWTFEI